MLQKSKLYMIFHKQKKHPKFLLVLSNIYVYIFQAAAEEAKKQEAAAAEAVTIFISK